MLGRLLNGRFHRCIRALLEAALGAGAAARPRARHYGPASKGYARVDNNKRNSKRTTATCRVPRGQ